MSKDETARDARGRSHLMQMIESMPREQARALNKARNAELDRFDAELAHAEEPIVADLHRAGVDVESPWDLVNTARPYPEALPILIGHLERGDYPDRVREGLARALAVAPAVEYWDRLELLYMAPRGPDEEEGLAIALSAVATPAHLEKLIGFLAVPERGDSRIAFLDSILRVGGERGREIVESLKSDLTFGPEATACLKSRRRRG